MHWPRIRGLAASAGVRLKATGNGDQRRPGPLRLGKGLYFTLYLLDNYSLHKIISLR